MAFESLKNLLCDLKLNFLCYNSRHDEPFTRYKEIEKNRQSVLWEM